MLTMIKNNSLICLRSQLVVYANFMVKLRDDVLTNLQKLCDVGLLASSFSQGGVVGKQRRLHKNQIVNNHFSLY